MAVNLDRPAAIRHIDVYAVSDVAHVLLMSSLKARRLIDGRCIEGAHRIGRQRRVTRQGLIRYIDSDPEGREVRDYRMKRLAEIDERRATKGREAV